MQQLQATVTVITCANIIVTLFLTFQSKSLDIPELPSQEQCSAYVKLKATVK